MESGDGSDKSAGGTPRRYGSEESEIGRILQLKTEIPKSQNARAYHVHFEISGFRF